MHSRCHIAGCGWDVRDSVLGSVGWIVLIGPCHALFMLRQSSRAGWDLFIRDKSGRHRGREDAGKGGVVAERRWGLIGFDGSGRRCVSMRRDRRERVRLPASSGRARMSGACVRGAMMAARDQWRALARARGFRVVRCGAERDGVRDRRAIRFVPGSRHVS